MYYFLYILSKYTCFHRKWGDIFGSFFGCNSIAFHSRNCYNNNNVKLGKIGEQYEI